MFLTASDETRLQALAAICSPIISSQPGGGITLLKDQFTQELANNNINNLVIGLNKNPKMQYQDVNKIWDPDLQIFKKTASFMANYKIIFDYYCLDGSSPSILNVLGAIICQTIFPKNLAMQPRAFEMPENKTFAGMLQGVLKQKYTMIITMICYNEYLIGQVDKTDKISIDGNLNDDTISSIIIDLD